jgi:aspartate/glutamate racemase
VRPIGLIGGMSWESSAEYYRPKAAVSLALEIS